MHSGKIILASASPRRRELLALLVPEFSVVPSLAEEHIAPDTPPHEAVRMLAKQKAADIFAKNPNSIVIGADTIVFAAGEILGKPRDAADARRMLALLSGCAHSVYTGVAVISPNGEDVFAEATQVTFRQISTQEIDAYVATGEPMDKAGAYGIQERAAAFVSGIHGDFFSVVGLPVCALGMALRRHL